MLGEFSEVTLFCLGDQYHAKSVVSEHFTSPLDGVDEKFRGCGNLLAGSSCIVGESSNFDDFESCFFNSRLEGLAGEKAGVGTSKNIVDGRGSAEAVEPGCDRDDQRAVVWGVEDQFSVGFEPSTEGFQDGNRIDQMFDDIHHRDDIKTQFGFHIGHIAVVDIEPLLSCSIGQRLAKLHTCSVESHRFSCLEHHSKSRADIEQLGGWADLPDPIVGGLENARIQSDCSGSGVIGIVKETFGVLFVVGLSGLAVKRFENQLALRTFFDDTVEPVGMSLWISNIVENAI